MTADTAPFPDTAGDWLPARVHAMIADDDPIDPDESLMLYGLDSMQVMELAIELEARGTPVSFAALAETPTLSAWRRLIAASAAGTVESEGA